MKKIFTLLLLVSFWSLMASNTTEEITCPTVTATLSSATMCSGSSTYIQLTSNVANTTFTWNATQIGVTGASFGSGDSITQVLRTTGTNAGNVTYTITPFADSCSGTPITVTVTVYPIPTVTASPHSETISSGQYTNIILTSNVYGTTCVWNVAQSQGVTGASNGNGYSITQTLSLINPSLAGHVDYIVTPIIGGCPGTPINVSVTVNPNLGTNDFNAQNFVINPNPVTDILNIKNNLTINNVTAFNQLGQMVLQKEYNSNEVQLDFSALKTGIYFIAVDSDNKQSTFKIAKK